jgi:hypothetical protein
MAFTLVFAGEHFVIDELVGWTYAIVVFVVGSRLFDRWETRRQRRKQARVHDESESVIADDRPVLERA